MAIWGAVVTGVVAAGSSYYQASQAKKAQKQQLKADRSEWEQRMAYENEKLARKQNSMGARMAPYLMDQMLHVYGEQTKGRGGFTLPIEEIMKNMNLEGRKNGTYNGGGGSYGGSGASQIYDNEPQAGRGGVQGLPFGVKEVARKAGTLNYSKGKVDAELEGDIWDTKGGSMTLEGAPSGGYGGFGGVTAAQVGGPREATRSNDGGARRGVIKSPTARYSHADGSSLEMSQDTPGWETDLATGGTFGSAGGTIELPPDLVKKLGVAGLKVGASMLVPGLGMIMNIGGKIVQKLGHSDGKQSGLETLFGIKDANYGKFFGKRKANPKSPIDIGELV